jgi:metal-responsive CopG/Arc/MetJ family transcriptional regulator
MTKVHIRFPEPLADAVDRAAKRRRTTSSEIIRQAVVHQLRRDRGCELSLNHLAVPRH